MGKKSNNGIKFDETHEWITIAGRQSRAPTCGNYSDANFINVIRVLKLRG